MGVGTMEETMGVAVTVLSVGVGVGQGTSTKFTTMETKS